MNIEQARHLQELSKGIWSDVQGLVGDLSLEHDLVYLPQSFRICVYGGESMVDVEYINAHQEVEHTQPHLTIDPEGLILGSAYPPLE